MTRARKKLVVGRGLGNWIRAKQGGVKRFVAYRYGRIKSCQRDESPQTDDHKIILMAMRVMKYYSFTTAPEELPEQDHIKSMACLACAKESMSRFETYGFALQRR